MIRSALSLAFGLISFILLSTSTANAKPVEPLNFTPGQAETAIEIIDKLANRHYRNQPFDDKLSSRYLDLYLETLDPSKVYFYKADIQEFEKYRSQFDDLLKAGKLRASFDIFHRYRERVVTRLESILNLLDSEDLNFDFNKPESLEIDRDESEWPADKATADELWRKRLKSSVLSLKLAGKTLDEAKVTLKKRYSNQMKRVLQQDNADAFEVVINSLTLLYDPHTSYLSPRTLENFNINMSLSLEGIGAVLQTEDEFTKVVRLIAAGPADKQGELKPADRIIAVGQGSEGEMVDVVGWRLDEVVKLIRGPKNTVVRLEVVSADAGADAPGKTIKISRGKVKLEEQAAKKAVFELGNDDEVYKIGVIDVPAFYIDFEAYRNRDPNFKSTTRDVLKLLKELQEENVDGIIIDLRNNGGGSLQEATTLTDLFIDQGPVVQIRQTNQRISRHYRSRSKARYRGPLLVLINRLSASASEIFAGAIQDYHRGIVVGAQTFGKGTVQSLTPLKEGQLKITESKFYRVSGDSTQHRGVIPDIELPTMVNTEEVGESSYDYALPWDQIHAAPHPEYFDLARLIPLLRKQHQARAEKDPDFVYLLQQLALIKESRDRQQISLQESQRLKDQQVLEEQSLTIENQRRKAKGLEQYVNVKAMREENAAEEETTAAGGPVEINPDKDPLLTEAGYILIDFMDALKQQEKPQVANF